MRVIRNLTCIAVLTVILFGALGYVAPSAFAEGVILHPINNDGTFDTWAVVETNDDKVKAVESTGDDGDNSYIFRASDSKRQTFSFPTNQFSDDTGVKSVTINVMVKRMDILENNIQFSMESGKAKILIHDTDELVPPLPDPSSNPEDDPYVLRSVTWLQNPFTGADWQGSEVNNWIVDGSQVYFGVNNQVRQGSEIRVTELWLDVEVLDNVPPTTTARQDPILPVADSWYTASPVNVILECNDNPLVDASGCFETTFVLDGTTTTVSSTDGVELPPFVLTDDGEYSYSFNSTDNAGNPEPSNGPILVKIDTVDPESTETHVPDPEDGINGWHVSDVTITLDATDATSGVDSILLDVNSAGEITLFATDAFVLSDGIHNILYHAVDVAGNVELNNTLALKIDTIPPTGTLSIVQAPSTTNSTVDLTISCTDATSGCMSMRVATDGVLDDEVSEDIVSSKSIILPAGRGEKTVLVEFSDNAGNTSVEQATIILDATINLDATISSGEIVNISPRWGIDSSSLDGSSTNTLESDAVKVEFGNIVTCNLITSDNWSATTTFPSGSFANTPHVVNATLVDDCEAQNEVTDAGNTTISVQPSNNPINVQKHQTILDSRITVYTNVPTNSSFTIVGSLVDAEDNSGLSGKSIRIEGNGTEPASGDDQPVLPDATTIGEILIQDGDEIEITECESVGCTNNENIVRLHQGAMITTPSNQTYVSLYMQDMGFKTMNVTVTAGNGDVFSPDTIGEAAGIDIVIYTITHPFGVNSIEVGEISGDGEAGISKLQTINSELIVLVEEDFTTRDAGIVPQISIDTGLYSSTGLSSVEIASNFKIKALFDGDVDYILSESDEVSYSTVYNSNAGLGNFANVIADNGKGFVTKTCSSDTDGDALCNNWETSGIPYKVGNTIYGYPLPGANVDHKDLYVEIDKMTGLSIQSGVLTDITTAYAGSPVTNPDGNGGITVHFIENDANVDYVETIKLWVDGNFNRQDDFGSIKSNWFGSINERTTIDDSNLNVELLPGKIVRVSGLTITTPDVDDAIQGATNEVQGVVTLALLVTTPAENGDITLLPTRPAFTAGTTDAGITILTDQIFRTAFDTGVENRDVIFITIGFTTGSAALTNAPLGTMEMTVFTSPGSSVESATMKSHGVIVKSTLMEAKANAFRYVLWANSFGGPSGQAELRGNDALVSLGGGGFTNSRAEQGGTLMHEMGHLLNLKHGGPAYKLATPSVSIADSDVNCKPNSDSVMTYSRQTANYLGADFKLDYSSGNLGTIDETDLTEADGLSGDGVIIPWGTQLATALQSFLTGPADGVTALDWSGDGVLTGDGSFDVNNFGIFGCAATPGQTYQGHDEWSNLDFDFRQGPIGQIDAAYPPPQSELDIAVVQQQKLANLQYAGALPPTFPDGTEIRKGGAQMPFKFQIFDTEGELIDFASAYATTTLKGQDAELGYFVWDEINQHYALGWKTPKAKGNTDVVVGINIFIENPGANPDLIHLLDPEHPLTVDGNPVTLIITLTK